MLKNILLMAGCVVCGHLHSSETLIPKAHKMIVKPAQAFLQDSESQTLAAGDLVQFKTKKLVTNIDVKKSKKVVVIEQGGLYQVFSAMQGTSTPGTVITVNITINGKTAITSFGATTTAFIDGSFYVGVGGPTYLQAGDKVSVKLESTTAPVTVTTRYLALLNSNNT